MSNHAARRVSEHLQAVAEPKTPDRLRIMALALRDAAAEQVRGINSHPAPFSQSSAAETMLMLADEVERMPETIQDLARVVRIAPIEPGEDVPGIPELLQRQCE